MAECLVNYAYSGAVFRLMEEVKPMYGNKIKYITLLEFEVKNVEKYLSSMQMEQRNFFFPNNVHEGRIPFGNSVEITPEFVDRERKIRVKSFRDGLKNGGIGVKEVLTAFMQKEVRGINVD